VARGALLVATLGALVASVDCGPSRRPEIRQGSKSYLFNITSDPIPPHAREDGEGRIFANTIEGARTYDGFEKGAAVGTYTAKLRFVAAGQWAIGIQFHSDSTKPLEKTEWMQDVLQERPGTP
jgi:hypothetical protein